MNKFLFQVARDLLNKYQNAISDHTLVFPNRRSGLFFTSYLNSLIEHPILSPEITTINDLFKRNSLLHVPDRLSLIFRLFKVYKQVTHTNELFDDFYYWGEMVISDFDQVDKYLVDARTLFNNITELKEIDERFDILQMEDKNLVDNFWKTVAGDGKSPNQQEFIRLWEDLAGVYEKFKSLLTDEGLAYEGMLYRNLTESGFKELLTNTNTEKFVFIGFNALNKCEEQLFSFLKENNKALFYWDYDHYYIDDMNQEAGAFLRNNMTVFPNNDFVIQSDMLLKGDKSVEIIRIASLTGQTQVASKVISDSFMTEQGFDETAIVLCDEELLLPMIGALPSGVEKINVTMGFPLKSTPVFSLIYQLTQLQKNGRRQPDGYLFYYKDVLKVLNHQLVVEYDQVQSRVLAEHIMLNNIIYLIDSELTKNELFNSLFHMPATVDEYADYFLEILNLLFQHWGNPTPDFETPKVVPELASEYRLIYREYIYQAYLTVNKLKDILVNDRIKVFESGDYISKEAFFRFLVQYLSGVAIPFEGEPLEGLQIMGILESRTLDFKNLIILSVNEGIMPKVNMSGSFIPYNLRKGFGLPTVEEQNAMYAYYFYRLLQRAENVTFVYDSRSGGLNGGEKSRYLYQLLLESAIQIKETSVSFGIEINPVKTISIPKNGKVAEMLNGYLTGKKTLSPSAVDKYLTCPLQFYFRYCAGLDEPDEVTEEVDAVVFGLLFHDVMETLYKPLEGKMVDRYAIELIAYDKQLIDNTIRSSFNKIHFRGKNDAENLVLTGRNWLICGVVKKYVLRLLEVDKIRCPFEIAGLELKVKASIHLEEFNQSVNIGGVIDRLERINAGFRILDYKSGKAEVGFPTMISLFDKENERRNKAAFQTLIYSWILHQNRPEISAIFPCIYPLRSLFDEGFSPALKSKENGVDAVEFISIAENFEAHFKKLLMELFDPEIPFNQTTILRHCELCAYRQICMR